MWSPDFAQYEIATAQTLINLQKYFRHQVAHIYVNGVILLIASKLEPSAWIVQSLLIYLEDQKNLQPFRCQRV